MGVTGGTMEDKKSHKKQKKEKEKEDMLKASAPKRKEKKKDSSAVVDSAVDKLVEDEESKGTHQKEKKKKKKDKLADDVMEVELTTIQEIKAPENQKEKKERKRKRDDGDEVPLSPQPKKKSKKVRSVEETKSTEDSSQVENAKLVKKHKSKKPVPDNTKPTEKSKKKKRKNKTGFPDPGEDDGTDLSDQAKKALTYAFTQFHDSKHWKFNKARQNWLVRNFWSVTAIPEKYEELVIQYLSAVQGNARENLVQTCRTVIDEAVSSTKGENTIEQKETIGGTLIDAPSAPISSQDNRKETRARALLQVLAPSTDT